MKTNTTFFIVIFLLCSFSSHLSAQHNLPFTIKVGVGLTEDEPIKYPSGYKETFNKVPLFLFEFGYEVFRNFDVSVYGAYANYMRISLLTREGNYESVGRSTSNAVFYGVRAKYDVFPLILKSDRDLRFELYPIATLGGVNAIWRNAYGGGTSSAKPYFECSVGVGAGLKITKGFGLYFEYGFGRFFSSTMHRIQGGLSFHF